MDILYSDNRILVAIKPCGVLSTDEEGGMPRLIRQHLGDEKACVRTVHRLDRVVSGVMVFARSRMAASLLSRQIREGLFRKEYLAVLHGCPEAPAGTLRDLLARDAASKTTFVTDTPGKDVKEALLHYQTLASTDTLSLVKIRLETGRTHQIRVQFSSRAMPLVGDKKYGRGEPCDIALWSHSVSFSHPQSGEACLFSALPPDKYPWNQFKNALADLE